MEESAIKLSWAGKRLFLLRSAVSLWLADIADNFVLLGSFALTLTSFIYILIIFLAQAGIYYLTTERNIAFLTRIISSLSLTTTSAVIAVVGKRYVFSKLVKGGLRTQRVAVYSSPTITNLASHLVLRRMELPLLGLAAVWVLALVTSFTVNDSWQMGSLSFSYPIAAPYGPLDVTSNDSWVDAAIGQLTFVMSSWCLGLTDAVGLIHITDTNTVADPSLQMGVTYYPPILGLHYPSDYSFVGEILLNSFNISTQQLSSVPSTARELTNCAKNAPTSAGYPQLWYDGSDNQTLSIIAVSNEVHLRINATAIIMAGTLFLNGSSTQFVPNGTTWPNIISAGSQWAEDITSIICNATLPPIYGNHSCIPSQRIPFNILLFATKIAHPDSYTSQPDEDYVNYPQFWGSVLNMAIGAYSSTITDSMLLTNSATSRSAILSVTLYGIGIKSTFWIYVLCLNVVVSFIMWSIARRLRHASRLGPDFFNPTRLLLDPLKKPELFNASLQATVDALADPYMLVGSDDEFLLAEQKTTREPARERRGILSIFYARERTRLDDFHDDSTMELRRCD